ncbi:response regulator [Shewanella sp. A25]|nr:response regulator [Shewanella shenzhenensis]
MSNKVLVVEDSSTFRKFVVGQLTRQGYDVVTASSYKEAEALLVQQQAFLCTVLDYCLPDAPHGEVIELAITHRQKVIVLTASFREEARERFIQQGVLDYILKDNATWVDDLLALVTRLDNNRLHHALVVDDSVLVRNYLARLLEHQNIRTSMVRDGEEALQKLKQDKSISFIVSDHTMPNMDGITMTREIRRQKDRNALPILGLSGSEDPTMTARFLKAGANDFLNKPFNQEEFYCRIHNLLAMKEANDSLFKLANQDYLTALWNRRYFFSFTKQVDTKGYIAILDIDHFKRVNDQYGHDCGDRVIRAVADALKLFFAKSCVARYGGEEFCIFYQGSYSEFICVLEQMRAHIAAMHIFYNDLEINISISIGATQRDAPIEELLNYADQHLYTAKQQGRNRLIHD